MGGTAVGNCQMRVASSAMPNPSAMPMPPPSRLITIGFDEKLQQHVASLGADRQADADLARPLGHRHQHDVHDADAADDERHAGDAGEKVRHGIDRRRPDVGDLLLRADREVVRISGHQLVLRSHDDRDGIGDVGDGVGARRRDRDVLNVLLSLQPLLHGRDRARRSCRPGRCPSLPDPSCPSSRSP